MLGCSQTRCKWRRVNCARLCEEVCRRLELKTSLKASRTRFRGRNRGVSEREGFEPPVQLPAHWFSKPAPSATRTPLLADRSHNSVRFESGNRGFDIELKRVACERQRNQNVGREIDANTHPGQELCSLTRLVVQSRLDLLRILVVAWALWERSSLPVWRGKNPCLG